MGTLGALWSQQLGFTITTTAGTTYTHGLGYTPTVVLLTGINGTSGAATFQPLFYTTPTATTVLIGGGVGNSANCDVLVGSLHSLIK